MPKIMKEGKELTSNSVIANVWATNETIKENEIERKNEEIVRENNELIRQEFYDSYIVFDDYSNVKEYVPNNKVRYQGGTYQNILASTGIPPTVNTNNSNWVCVAAKGQDGSGVGDMTACYHPDTDILTSNGFVSIKDVNINDEVATLSTDTDEIIYQKVKNVFKYDNVENLYEISNQQIDLSVTLNHKMLVKPREKEQFKLYEARDIVGKRVEYKKDGVWKGNYIQYITIDDVKIPIELYAEYMGYFLSEGCTINAVNGQGSKDYLVCVSQVKPRTRERMVNASKKIADLFGRKSFINNKYNFKISDKRLYNHLKQFGKSYEKFVPRDILNSTSNVIKIFLEAYIDGDGNRSLSSGRITEKLSIFTTSPQMVSDLQESALKVGWSGNSYINAEEGKSGGVINGREIIARRPCYTVSINKKKNTPMVNHGHEKQQNIQSEKIVSYGGSVYCVEVEDYHTLYVRRNGKVVWCGNSVYDKNNKQLDIYDYADTKVSQETFDDEVYRLDDEILRIDDELYDKADKSVILNSTNITESGFILDGRVGKTLNDKIDGVTGKINGLTGFSNANNVLEYGVYWCSNSVVNTPVSDFGILIVNNGVSNTPPVGWVFQEFLATNGDRWSRRNVNGEWSVWVDSRAANSLNGKNASDFLADKKRSLTVTDLNNPNYPEPYVGSFSNSLAVEIGLNANWWHIMYFKHQDNNGYGAQIAIPLDSETQRPVFRISLGTTWRNWTYLSDNGNAGAVNGYSIAVVDTLPSTQATNTIYFVKG